MKVQEWEFVIFGMEGGGIKCVVDAKDFVWFDGGRVFIGEDNISGDGCSRDSGGSMLPRGDGEKGDVDM